MRLLKRWLLILIFVLSLGSMAGWSLLTQNQANAATPTPIPTPSSDDVATIPSPDGRWMAIVNNPLGSLDVQRLDGQVANIFPSGSTVRAFTQSDGTSSYITWSPDSRTLLVVQTNWLPDQPAGTGVEASSPIEIWQIGFDESGPGSPTRLYQSQTPLEDGPQQILFGPWSPDSHYVLFWEGILSASILADGLSLSALEVSTGQITLLAEITLLNPRYQSWSPDSSALAFTARGYRSAQVDKWLNIWDVATGQITSVISQTEQIPGIVAWSPQGDQIAYAAVPTAETDGEWADTMTPDNPAIAGRRIYLLDPTTGESHRLNQAESYQDAPLWNEDGSMLYYVERVGDIVQLMEADPTSGQAQAVAGISQPIIAGEVFPAGGYYGQSNWDALLAQRPGGSAEAAPAATPSPDDLAVVRFIFKNHPPLLGSLTEDFLKKVDTGQYSDFSVQEADLTSDGQSELVVIGRIENIHLFVAILARDPGGKLAELFYTEKVEDK